MPRREREVNLLLGSIFFVIYEFFGALAATATIQIAFRNNMTAQTSEVQSSRVVSK